ncbi:transcriptional regulator FnrL [Yoonia sp.]|uniref:transcriptional regulator FnrL n=1 Tax=Yoonia sp. TaxID=2212373 RepID=UPI001A0DA032|nr:Crp/Fnr family transcriptional regulator [Yoonia sp.]MBE0412982.1 Crp/Fnr family transcriptional regulator [Yoonia sp.]
MEKNFSKEKSCDSCPIRHRAVCASCEPNELATLDQIKTYRNYDAGQPIIFAGDQMPFVGSLVTGTATLEQMLEDGRKQTVGLLLPSDFIGRPGRELAPYDVTAVTDVTLCCFQKPKFEELLRTTPHVSQRLLEMALDELDAARDWMLLLGRKTAREKIATFIIMIEKRLTHPTLTRHQNERHIILPLTREAMSDYLGLTIETVSRQFSALKKDELIRLEGKRGVTIPDITALRDVAGY